MKSTFFLLVAFFCCTSLLAEEVPVASEAALAAPAPEAALAAPAPAPAPEAAPAAEVPAKTRQENAANATTANDEQKAEAEVDFENEDTFVDLADALKSKQYVRRAILSTVIRTTSKLAVSRWYISHTLGFNSVWMRTDGNLRYYSPSMGLSLGYVTAGMHGFEGGIDMSVPGDLYLGYRYYMPIEKVTVWPFLGGGAGMEIKTLALHDPPYIRPYTGPAQFFFANAGIMVPLVEVALKLDIKITAYATARLMLSSGVGAIFFL